MKYPYGFSANLSQDAKGLSGLLAKIFSSEAILELQNSYLLACQHNGLLEHSELRTPESSFNPRPARVVQILIQNFKIKDLKTLKLGFLITSDLVANSELEHIRNFSNQSLDQNQAAVLIANYLDLLRHCHMTKNDDFVKETVQQAELIFNQLAELFLNSEVYPMLELALKRAKKLVSVTSIDC